MTLLKTIRWMLYIATGFAGFLAVVLLVLAFIRIPINLESQKGLMESIVSKRIKRQVSINGKMQVITSLWPVFIFEDVHIKNPENFEEEDFALLHSGRIKVGLIKLLLGRIWVREFKVNGLELSLQVDEKDQVNWVFNGSSHEPEKLDDKEILTPDQQSLQITSDSLIVAGLNLSDIAVSYISPGMEKPLELKIDKCTGSVLPDKPFQVTLQGSIQEEHFEILIRAESLNELLEENRSWVEIETKIANAQLKFSGDNDLTKINRTSKFNLSVRGEGLENFNRMLHLDLPPIPSYGLNTSLSIKKGLIELTDLKLQVSNSELTGNMKVNNAGPIPEVVITLQSPLLQINDFVFDDWSPIRKVKEDTEAAENITIEMTEEKSKHTNSEVQNVVKELDLFSPEFLKKINASFSISANKVLSGEDQLGSGKISVSLKDGRISLDPVNLSIPGGSLFMSMSIKPGMESADASLRVQVENFDFGVLARRVDPKTELGGKINIDVNLHSSAKAFSELLDNGTGYFDFSAKPENLESGIMDLWAISVISAIVSHSVKGQSHIEYWVGRWSMEDGYLEPDVFVIDTTRIRICGKGWVDFNKKKLKLEVVPTPKKPEFFSLAKPIYIEGDFLDFGSRFARRGLMDTGIRFVASPIKATLQTIFDKPIPADGNDLWAIQLGPENRKMKPPIGCR